jgi:hypothetical protein
MLLAFWCMIRILRGFKILTTRQALALVQMPAGKPVRMPKDRTQCQA